MVNIAFCADSYHIPLSKTTLIKKANNYKITEIDKLIDKLVTKVLKLYSKSNLLGKKFQTNKFSF